MPESSYQTAAREFGEWLDTVCTPVNMERPLVAVDRDYPQEKHDKKEQYRHQHLMKNSFWYRQSYVQEKRREQLALLGKTLEEPPELQLGDTGFWDQFKTK